MNLPRTSDLEVWGKSKKHREGLRFLLTGKFYSTSYRFNALAVVALSHLVLVQSAACSHPR